MTIRIDRKYIFFLICTIVYLKPNYFDSIGFLDILFSVSGMLIFLVQIFLLFINGVKMERMLVYTIIFSITPIFSTIFHSGNIFSSISLCTHYIGIYLLLQMEVDYNPKLLYKLTLPIVKLWVFVNFLTMVFFPSGLYRLVRSTGWTSNQAWFLGLRNSHPFWMLYLMMLIYMRYVQVNTTTMFDRLSLLFWTCVCEYSLINNGGSGALVGGLLIAIYVVFRKWLEKIGYRYLYLIFNLSFFVMFVVIQMQNGFLRNIVGLLKRNLTFTGRTYVWKAAIAWFLKSPIFGWGIEQDSVILSKIGVTGDTAFIKCHNIFLDLLYSGGIITFGVFIFILIMIIRYNTGTDNKIFSCVSWFFLFSTLLLGQTETAIITNVVMYMMYTAFFAARWEA